MLTVLVAAALLWLPAHGASPGAKQPSGWIVFTSDRDGDWDAYAARSDGTGLVQLTNGGGVDSDVFPSPDGASIAFEAWPGIFVTGGGGPRRRIPTCGVQFSAHLSWSPDSEELACLGDDDGLWVVRADGRAARRLVGPAVDPSAPHWSPSGELIAFGTRAGLFVIAAEGGEPRRVSTKQVAFGKISWSPDSARIAFITPRGRVDDLYVAHVTGGGEQKLVEDVGPLSRPVWSPDGEGIALSVQARGDRTEIAVVGANGGRTVTVTRSSAGESAGDPSWSPDGSALTYVRTRSTISPDGADVYVVTLADMHSSPVTSPFPDGGSNSSPVWVRRTASGTPIRRGIGRIVEIRPTDGVALPDVRALAADGRRVAVLHRCGVAVWEKPHRGSLMRFRTACDRWEESGPDVALASTRVAWTREFSASGGYFASDLLVADTRRRRVIPVAYALQGYENEAPDWDPEYLGNLHGEGDVLAFNSWTSKGKANTAWKTWRIAPRPGTGRCPDSGGFGRSFGHTAGSTYCVRLPTRRATRLLAVDRGRLVMSAGAAIMILDRAGRALQRLRSVGAVDAARLDKETLIVLVAHRLKIYDLRLGRVVHIHRLRVTASDKATLEDVDGDLVAYTTGAAVHLVRLSTGRDIAIYAANQGTRVHAQLEASGLFYAYNEIHTRRGARLSFTPYAKLLPRIR